MNQSKEKLIRAVGFLTSSLLFCILFTTLMILTKKISYNIYIIFYVLLLSILFTLIYLITTFKSHNKDTFLKGMKDFGMIINFIINYILTTILYFFGIGLTSIFAKIFNKTFINIKSRKNLKSYWEDYGLKKEKTESYYHQF